MNSADALAFALNVLRIRQRRLTQLGTPSVNPTADAIETLEALRELLTEQCRHTDVRRPVPEDNVYRCNGCSTAL